MVFSTRRARSACEGLTLVDYVEQHSRVNADELAYRYIDYSRERDGEAQELTWQQFGVRLRAVAARLQQVTKPGDRVAILAPQGLDYVIFVLRRHPGRHHRGAAVRSGRAGPHRPPARRSR